MRSNTSLSFICISLAVVAFALFGAASPALADATVTPAAAALTRNQTQNFVVTLTAGTTFTSASVSGGTGTVTWQVLSTSTVVVTYTAPGTINTQQTVTLTVATSAGNKTATITLLPAVSISVSPASVTLFAAQTQQFSVSPAGTAVTWGISTSGDPSVVGAIDPSSGLYTAPTAITGRYSVTVTATSATLGTATATVTLSDGTAALSISPTSSTLTKGQSTTFTVSQPITNYQISPGGIGTVTRTSDYLLLYTAPASLSQVFQLTLTVTTASGTVTATITLNPSITVVVAPAAVTLGASQQQAFTAMVDGTTNTAVTWKMTQGDPTVLGTVDPNSGLYIAPDTITTRQTVTITATSVADPTKSGTATVTLQNVSVTVTPAQVTLNPQQAQVFSAVVAGASSSTVTWSISPQIGTITPAGLYTAPDTVTSKTTVTVTATSTADPTKTGTATVTLNASTMTVSPATVTLTNGQTQQFTVTVTVGTPPDVRWTLSPTNAGTIDANGLYTAPSVVQTATKVTLTATAVADSTRTAAATINLSPYTDVGHGAPTASITEYFVQAFSRNGFNNMCSLPPIADVRRFGNGLIQEFNDANKTSGVKLALVKPNSSSDVPATGYPVYQVWADVYASYGSIGSGTAGYPTMDTASCGMVDPSNTCTYQLFDKPYAIFAYKAPILANQTVFTISGAMYTKWAAIGGVSGPGRPVDSVTSITASTGNTAQTQSYSNGSIYTISTGAYAGKTFAVVGQIYSQYKAANGPSGTLGLPTADEITLSSGVHHQTFQGGAIDYNPGSDPNLKASVKAVTLTGMPTTGILRLNMGDTLTLTATASAANGALLDGRTFTWTSTNGQVVSIQANNNVAVIKGIGGGMAYVTVSAEGITSAPVNIQVIAPCCRVGEGAPTPAISQAFQDAVTRNALKIAFPSQSAVSRVGAGYVQLVQSQDGVSYLLAKPDKLASTFVVSGNILKRYQDLGGPAGILGYPTSDATASGRQLFDNGYALAGSPVRVVGGIILTKWASLGYEAGAGMAAAEVSPAVLTFGANTAIAQAFSGGAIYGAISGPLAGQAFFVKNPILARYVAIGGAAGNFGMPVSAEFAASGLHQQKFEGGTIDYSDGQSTAQEHAAARQPSAVAVPSSVLAGSRVRLAIYGFADNSTLRVSVSGQPDFLAKTTNGAYTWEAFVPLSAKSGSVAVQASDTASSAQASVSYDIKGLADNRVQIVRVQGDNQSGTPGSTLPTSLRIALKDASGAGIAGVPVTFTPSPGAKVSVTNAVTDQQGQAETMLRLPLVEGVALVSADAPGVALSPVTFGARSVAGGLANYPKIMAVGDALIGGGSATIGQKGALLAAMASMLRYHQNRGELGAPNGQADAGTLNTFLTSWCSSDAQGSRVCDGYLSSSSTGERVANPWRAAEFTGGVDAIVLPPDPAAIADAVGQGSPVLLSLAITAEGNPAGGHYVVATGIDTDGSILIHDPSPDFARTGLNDYLNGFPLGSAHWQGTLKGAVRFALGTPSSRRFLVASVSQPAAVASAMALDARSIDGSCGPLLEAWDAVSLSAASSGGVSRFQLCDGSDPLYQISIGTNQPYKATVTDLSSGGSVFDISGSDVRLYKATRPVLPLTVTPLAASFDATAVVNAATFTPGIAPGGIMAIFGVGLKGGSTATAVDVDGTSAKVLYSDAFQVNAEVPPATAPGTHNVRVQSGYGTAQQSVNVSAVAPFIFVLGSGQGAVLNQDNSLNAPSNPLRRGQTLVVYCTGLGTVTKRGNLSYANATVTALLNGTELPTAFAGLAPGFTGLYQVNVAVPASTAPALDLPLAIKAGGVTSNSVSVALQ